MNPNGLTIDLTGPDPTLSLPANLTVVPGGTIVVPVDIDQPRPEASTGLVESILALRFDPSVFEVSASDIQLGTVPASSSGWQLTAAINNQTGEIGIDLFGMSAIPANVGGSLVTLILHVRAGAEPGPTSLSIVSQVNPTGERVYQTEATDVQGPFVLHTAATGGLVTVKAMDTAWEVKSVGDGDGPAKAVNVVHEIWYLATVPPPFEWSELDSYAMVPTAPALDDTSDWQPSSAADLLVPWQTAAVAVVTPEDDNPPPDDIV